MCVFFEPKCVKSKIQNATMLLQYTFICQYLETNNSRIKAREVLNAIEYRSRQNPFYIQLWNCVIFRLLLAVLIKHHDLAHVILGLVEHGQGDAGKIVLPKSIVELLRVVGQVKRSLIKVSQLPS